MAKKKCLQDQVGAALKALEGCAAEYKKASALAADLGSLPVSAELHMKAEAISFGVEAIRFGFLRARTEPYYRNPSPQPSPSRGEGAGEDGR